MNCVAPRGRVKLVFVCFGAAWSDCWLSLVVANLVRAVPLCLFGLLGLKRARPRVVRRCCAARGSSVLGLVGFGVVVFVAVLRRVVGRGSAVVGVPPLLSGCRRVAWHGLPRSGLGWRRSVWLGVVARGAAWRGLVPSGCCGPALA